MNYFERQQHSVDTLNKHRIAAQRHQLAQKSQSPTLGTSSQLRKGILLIAAVVTIVLLALAETSNVYAQEILLDRSEQGIGSAHFAFVRGFNALHYGQYEEAVDLLSRSIERADNYAPAYAFRATAYYLMGDFTPALADYDVAITLSPDYTSAYNWRGMTHLACGDYAQALADSQIALQLDPYYGEAYLTQGRVYLAQGAYLMAAVRFTQSVLYTQPNTW